MRPQLIAAVVPVTDPKLFRENVLSSPDLQFAEIIDVCGARSAAEAFSWGCGQTDASWILFCHQDVYFPAGSCTAIAELVAAVPPGEEEHTIIGFCGMGMRTGGEVTGAGTVLDRGHLLDWPESFAAVSIDEYAILLHRDCKYQIDANLGWHLWATDLCLQAIKDYRYARIVRVLLHHNSVHGKLPPEFHESGWVLARKYRDRKVIHTLNGIGEACHALRAGNVR